MPVPLTLNPVSLGFECSTDINLKPGFPLLFNGPPPVEGETAGGLQTYDVEAGSDVNPVFNLVAPQTSSEITLDAEPSSGQGALDLTQYHSVTDAFEAINETLGDLQVQVANGAGAAKDGFQLPLGPVETEGAGAWSPGPVPIQDTSKVSNVLDALNSVLGRLLPSPPPAFPGGVTLQITNAVGASPLLCAGVTDNAAYGLSAGQPVIRITDVGVSSNAFNVQGPAEKGAIEAILNAANVQARTLAGAGDVGDYGGLVISAEADYPSNQPGFWKAISLYLSELPCPLGVNHIWIDHTAAGATNGVTFVRDEFTAAPALSSVTVSEQAQGTLNYSSGVPHYGVGGQLKINAALTDLAGETYYGGADPLAAQVSGGGSALQAYGYSQLGFSVPFARSFAGGLVSALVLAVNGSNAHGSGRVQLTGKNVNGSTAAAAGPTILFKTGTAQGVIDELSVSVVGLGATPSTNNAARVALNSGDTPSGASSSWSATASLPVFEAAVVGGVLSNNDTDYSSGYLPAGPDYSVGRAGDQYVTFAFNRAAVSGFKINVAGAYAQCHVKLPGVTDQASISPHSPNGWMNAFAAYTGAGVPGASNDPTAGCASGAVMSGGSGSFQITFGTQSSTNATANQILVRFKLSPGQSITALSFTN